MKKFKILYSVLLAMFIILNNVFGQTKYIKLNSAYLISCYGTLENGTPVIIDVVQKDLTFFKMHEIEKNEDDFLCSLFKNSVLFVDPFLTRLKNKQLYGFLNESQSNLFYKKYNKMMSALNKSYKPYYTPKFSNNKCLRLEIAKVNAEFWLTKTDKYNIYPISESFSVSASCYEPDYLYNMKTIDVVLKLNADDLKILSFQFQSGN